MSSSEPTEDGMTSEPTVGTKKVVILQSSDGQRFEVEEAVAVMSQFLKGMIDDDCADTAIPLQNITGAILSKVIEYCKRHVDASSDEDLNDFDADFVKVGKHTLFDLSKAASYMNIKPLLDLTLKAVAEMIKDKKPEEVRKFLRVKNDFTPEVEEQVRRDTQWAFDFDVDEERARRKAYEEYPNDYFSL